MYEDLSADSGSTFAMPVDFIQEMPDTIAAVVVVHPVEDSVNSKVDTMLDGIDRLDLTRKIGQQVYGSNLFRSTTGARMTPKQRNGH